MIGKGKAHVGKMDAILSDTHLDARVKICIMMNVMAPKPRAYAGKVSEGNAKFVRKLETIQMTAAKKVLGCVPKSARMRNTAVSRAELGM